MNLKKLLTNPPYIKIQGNKVKAWKVPEIKHIDRMVEAIEKEIKDAHRCQPRRTV